MMHLVSLNKQHVFAFDDTLSMSYDMSYNSGVR